MKKFHLKLAKLPSGTKYSNLDFSSFVENSHKNLENPLVSSICGDNIDYGKLFAYCFRRFGYPNSSWDSYKELTSYLLSTPKEDMFLKIVPNIDNISSITFRFIIPFKELLLIEKYARRFQNEWHKNACEWREREGLPEWIPEWVDFYKTNICKKDTNAEVIDWKSTIVQYPLGPSGSDIQKMTSRFSEFYQSIIKEYQNIEKFADYYNRPENISSWDDSDPLKPYAEAAEVALRDLFLPVMVRDQAINAFGSVDHDSRTIKYAGSAGFPSGDIANNSPREFAELHELLIEMGNGSEKRGIKKALKALKSG